MSKSPTPLARMAELAKGAAARARARVASGAAKISTGIEAAAKKAAAGGEGWAAMRGMGLDVARRHVYELTRAGKREELAAYLSGPASGHPRSEKGTDSDGSTRPLFVCALRADEATAQVLVDAGFKLGERDRWGATILSTAAEANHVGFCRWALERGARVDRKRENGADPLSKAAASGAAEAFWLLEGVRGPSRAERVGFIRIAAKSGKDRLLAEMLARPDWDSARRSADADSKSPTLLMLAAFSGSHECAKLLAASSDAGARRPAWWRQHVDRAEGRPDHLVDAAFVAASRLPAKGSMDTLKLLATLGATLGNPGSRGRTVLHQAAMGASKPQMAWLLDQGLDPKAPDAKGDTPLALAVGHLNPEAAAELIPVSDVDARSLNGDAPLMRCAWRPAEDGENVEDVDVAGKSSHREDSKLDPVRVSMARALVAAGADPEARAGPGGMRALELAARCGRAGLFRELLPLCDLSAGILEASGLEGSLGRATAEGAALMRADLAREIERRELESAVPGAGAAPSRRL